MSFPKAAFYLLALLQCISTGFLGCFRPFCADKCEGCTPIGPWCPCGQPTFVQAAKTGCVCENGQNCSCIFSDPLHLFGGIIDHMSQALPVPTTLMPPNQEISFITNNDHHSISSLKDSPEISPMSFVEHQPIQTTVVAPHKLLGFPENGQFVRHVSDNATFPSVNRINVSISTDFPNKFHTVKPSPLDGLSQEPAFRGYNITGGQQKKPHIERMDGGFLDDESNDEEFKESYRQMSELFSAVIGSSDPTYEYRQPTLVVMNKDCHNALMQRVMLKTVLDYRRSPDFNECNIHMVAHMIQSRLEDYFKLTFEVIVGLKHIQSMTYYRGNMTCLLPWNEKTLYAYATPIQFPMGNPKANSLSEEFGSRKEIRRHTVANGVTTLQSELIPIRLRRWQTRIRFVRSTSLSSKEMKYIKFTPTTETTRNMDSDRTVK
ncbi:hypothetical protein AB6A40_007434 [Gnathostoma spinigerum]|uniref:Ground-like domain-containing protein n=1 Tax=Gnathostoma spinigerum TaxID=75299 RepID=A0ABD6EMF7_9BILA